MMQRLPVSVMPLFNIPELNATPGKEFSRAGLRRLRLFRPGGQNMPPSVSNSFESLYALNPTLLAGLGDSGYFSSEMVITENF